MNEFANAQGLPIAGQPLTPAQKRKITRRENASGREASPMPLPLMPPATAREQAEKAELIRLMEAASKRLRQRNLDNAVALANQAARGQGPLVDHFAELGRRFAHELEPQKMPALRVVDGGRTAP